MGYAASDAYPELSIEELVDLADKMMYENKEAHYRGMQPEARRQMQS